MGTSWAFRKFWGSTGGPASRIGLIAYAVPFHVQESRHTDWRTDKLTDRQTGNTSRSDSESNSRCLTHAIVWQTDKHTDKQIHGCGVDFRQVSDRQERFYLKAWGLGRKVRWPSANVFTQSGARKDRTLLCSDLRITTVSRHVCAEYIYIYIYIYTL